MTALRTSHHRRLLAWGGLGLLVAACTWFGVAPTAEPPLQTPTVEAAEAGVALTIYNQGTALVRDRRQFDLRRGMNSIDFREVAASIDPTSVLFKSLTDPKGTVVLEQNYEFDLVGSAALLEKYLDEQIAVVTEDGKTHAGTLLSGRGDIILRKPDGGIRSSRLRRSASSPSPNFPRA